MTEPKIIARRLASRLAEREIRIKHVQALDLIAAGAGLANRHVLATLKNVPPIRKVAIGLLTSAATVLAQHDVTRRQIIIDETSSVLLPTHSDNVDPVLEALAEAETTLREIIDQQLAAFSSNDDSTGDPDDGASLIDYDRLALAIVRRFPDMRFVGPLELALRDGADRCRDLLVHFSDDPDTAGGTVKSWVGSVDSAFLGANPSLEEQRALLSDGFEAVSNISHWLEPDDLLRDWLNVAAYPSAIDNRYDPEASGDPLALVFFPSAEICLSAHDLSYPESYLTTDRARPIVQQILEDAYFTRWEPSQRGLSQEDCVKIASRAISYLRTATSSEERRFAAERAIVESVRHNSPSEEWYSSCRDKAETILDAIEADLEALPIDATGFDRDEWLNALQDICEAMMTKKDKSCPADIVSSHDKVEVVFHMTPSDGDISDMCSIAGPFLDPEKMVIDDRLRHALAVLGHGVGEFRSAMGNKMPSLLSGRRPSAKIAPDTPLLTLGEVKELIENSCSTYFNFVGYARVTLQDLFDLDFTKPFAFSQLAIASYNMGSGTFHDRIIKREVILKDGLHGRLETVDMGYSPDDICGLHLPAYDAELYEPDLRRRSLAATCSLDANLAVEALRRVYPGHKVHWSPDSSGQTLEAQVGVYDAARGYSVRDCIAVFESTRSDVPEVKIMPKKPS